MKITRLGGALALALLVCVPMAASAQDDKYGSYADNVNAPCRKWVAIVPNDTTDLTALPKALYVGTGGDMKMIGVDAPAGAPGVVWKAVPSASLLPTRPRRVLATGTTASNIVGCF